MESKQGYEVSIEVDGEVFVVADSPLATEAEAIAKTEDIQLIINAGSLDDVTVSYDDIDDLTALEDDCE